MSDPEITPQLIEQLGLSPSEYEEAKKVLGRDPNFTELGVFSVMYSEHCSYKNSRPVLKLFPTTGEKILVKAGEENAGVVDIGDGWCISFKVESHNHPSAIEPFQGAATGVGGILRDIFTMGARPILLMNSLRFGSLDNSITRHLFKGVVGGIGFYGNCVGIPTVGGEVYFDECYEGNPLVNALALGVMRKEEIARGKAEGIGNPVFYVGASTGRDGIGGASFASKDLSEESHEDRPAVQAGDPFMEKLLMEAVLELLATDAVVGIQDMGAAGLTCGTCETAARGSAGVEIDTVHVPQRETGMTPYEVLLSESQERMLVIVKKGREAEVKAIFDKWDLHAVEIGSVTEGEDMVVKENGKEVVRIPAKKIADEAPIYHREEKKPEYLENLKQITSQDTGDIGDLNAALLKLLDAPTIASKAWVWQQYDHQVGTETEVLPGSDASVVRIKGTDKKIAVSTDCNALYCYLDPYEGGKIAVAEAARNVVCSGAKPLAITDCLNFGNPMKPEVFWTFKKAVEGIRDACLEFDTPVTGGNVSFYNESPKGAVDPTPVVGMAGVLEGREPVQSHFKKAGDAVLLLGKTFDELGGTQLLRVIKGLRDGLPPRLNLKEAGKFNRFMIMACENNLLQSAHDISEGGLAVAMAECCFGRQKVGAKVNVDDGLPYTARYFSESQSRAVLSADQADVERLLLLAKECDVELKVIGETQADMLMIDDKINVPLQVICEAWEQGIPRRMAHSS